MNAPALRRTPVITRRYAALSGIYDATLGLRFFRGSRRAFRSLAARFGIAPRSAADLGAGTGLFAAWLARTYGARVYAVERSPCMLRAGSRRMARAGVMALLQDIRWLALPHPVELVVANYDTINHLLRPGDVRAAFAAVARNLLPSGFFIFDVISSGQPAGTQPPVVFRRRDVRLVQRVNYSPDSGLLRVGIRISSNDTPDLSEQHVERIYPLATLARLLNDAGLVVRGLFNAEDGKPVQHAQPPRVIFVAQRRRNPGHA